MPIYKMSDPDSKDKYTLVGKGAFGRVWSYMLQGKRVAVKLIKVQEMTSLQSALREIHVLLYKSKHMIQLQNISYKYNHLEIHMEYMAIDLRKALKLNLEKDVPIGIEDTVRIANGCFQALHFLHKHSIAHRDMKPGNILLQLQNNTVHAKVCDFGLARQFSNELCRGTDYMVTRWYRAPEIIDLSSDYGLKIDIWSMGCILHEILHLQPLFQIHDACELKDKMKELPMLLETVEDKSLKKLISNTLKENPDERWSAEKCIMHLKLPVESVPAQKYYEKDISLNVQYEQTFKELLKRNKEYHRVIMHALMLFNETKQTYNDYTCSIIVSYCIFESDFQSLFFETFWKEEMTCTQVAMWYANLYTNLNLKGGILSMYEKNKDVEKVLKNIFIQKKRKRYS